jgi:hypothetical protein
MKAISLLLIFLSACATERHDPLVRKLRQCYTESDSYTGRLGKVQGEMTVKLLIDPQGMVKEFKIVKNDFPKDYNLHACVQGIFKNTRMEKSLTGQMTEVLRPVTFQAVKQ